MCADCKDAAEIAAQHRNETPMDEKAETLFRILHQTYEECLTPLAKAFGFDGPELDDAFVDYMNERAAELAALRKQVAAHKAEREPREIDDEMGKRIVRWGLDDPALDGTDGAHLAWWRGNDDGVRAVVRIVSDLLDGNPHVGTFGSADLELVAKRIALLVAAKDAAIGSRDLTIDPRTERNETPTEQMTGPLCPACNHEAFRHTDDGMCFGADCDCTADPYWIVTEALSTLRSTVATLTEQLREARERADTFDAACVKALDARDAALAEAARLRAMATEVEACEDCRACSEAWQGPGMCAEHAANTASLFAILTRALSDPPKGE